MKLHLAFLLCLTALRAAAQDTKPSAPPPAQTPATPAALDAFNKALSWLPEFIGSAFDHDNLPGIIRGDRLNVHLRSEETRGYVKKKKPPFWFIFHLTKGNDSSQSVYSYLACQDTAQAPWSIRSAWRTDKEGVRHLYPTTQTQPPSKTAAARSPRPAFNLGHLKAKPSSTDDMPWFDETWQRLREMQHKGTAPGLLPDDKTTVEYPTGAVHPDFSISRAPPYVPMTITKKSDGTFLQYLFVRNATGSWKLGSAWTISAAGLLSDLEVPARQELIIKNDHEFTAPYLTDMFALCSVTGGWAEPPEPDWWSAVHPDRNINGVYTTADLLKYCQQLPRQRKRKGILIMGSLTHLRDLEKAKTHMDPSQLKDCQNADLLKAKRAFVQELKEACDKAKIPLWINTNLGGQDITYIRLSPSP